MMVVSKSKVNKEEHSKWIRRKEIIIKVRAEDNNITDKDTVKKVHKRKNGSFRSKWNRQTSG